MPPTINMRADDELAQLLEQVTGAQLHLEQGQLAASKKTEVELILLNLAACKADLVELLERPEHGGPLPEDTEMLVNHLRSEILMLSARVQVLTSSRRAAQHRRLLEPRQ
jgi:hypothetical protein